MHIILYYSVFNYMQVACAGAVIAASFSMDKILDMDGWLIDHLNDNVRQRTKVTAAVAIASGVVIPLEILMIVLRLFKISLGALGRIIVVVV